MQNVISDYCINAQDWIPGDFTPITAEQLKALNRLLSEIPGEHTLEQVEAIVRSVMTPSS
jgi:hypothetical protein